MLLLKELNFKLEIRFTFVSLLISEIIRRKLYSRDNNKNANILIFNNRTRTRSVLNRDFQTRKKRYDVPSSVLLVPLGGRPPVP